MEKVWKIAHSGKADQSIKTTVRVEPNKTVAVAINTGEFVLAMPYKTAQLEAQSIKRHFLTIDEDFDNSYLDLNLGEIYKEDSVESMKKDIK